MTTTPDPAPPHPAAVVRLAQAVKDYQGADNERGQFFGDATPPEVHERMSNAARAVAAAAADLLDEEHLVIAASVEISGGRPYAEVTVGSDARTVTVHESVTHPDVVLVDITDDPAWVEVRLNGARLVPTEGSNT